MNRFEIQLQIEIFGIKVVKVVVVVILNISL